MPKKLLDKIKEAVRALLPIAIVILILNFTFAPMPFKIRCLFIMGVIFLILGLGLFRLGADLAVLPIGEHLGQTLSKSRKISIIVICSFILGAVVVITDPGLQNLAMQIPGIPTKILIPVVATGVGILLVVAILRIILQWQLRYVLFVLYLFILILSFFVPDEYIPVAFDASGVTTTHLAVPFILALGIGISGVRGGKSSRDDSFGLVALASVGPIIAIMFIIIFTQDVGQPQAVIPNISGFNTLNEFIPYLLDALSQYTKDMVIAILPIVILFLIVQVAKIKLPVSQLIKMGVGIVYIIIGFVLFLTGANLGFLPAGSFIGAHIGSLDMNFLLIPIGAVIGYFIVLAEPAVYVIINQIEDITGGAISSRLMLNSLSISVALSVALAITRVYLGISILGILIPGYALALGLSFVVPKLFTAIAFDSGGVVSGPLTASFLFPLTVGASMATGGNFIVDAFGTVAMVAMTPLFAIQIIGLIYKLKIEDTTNDEWGTIEDIADMIEEKEFLDWGESIQSSEVYDDYKDIGVDNMEFVASPEWTEIIHDENVWEEITADNSYIDFDEIEMKHYQSMVIPEDFDIPSEEEEKDS